MLVTLNCSVKPTAAIARIDAVISPKPMAGESRSAYFYEWYFVMSAALTTSSWGLLPSGA
jgi:hypothetical protein